MEVPKPGCGRQSCGIDRLVCRLANFPDGYHSAIFYGDISRVPWLSGPVDDGRTCVGRAKGICNRKTEVVVSMEADEVLVTDVIARLGDEHLVISTDYPHPDSAFPNAMDEFFSLELPDETRRRVLWDNTARLYGFEA